MKKLLQKKRLFVVLFWLWLITIFILSSLPNIPTQKINVWNEPFRLDYIEHFGVFFILASLFVLARQSENFSFDFKKNWVGISLLLVFASVDEIHQIWIVGRSFNPLDLIYNELGLLSALVITPYLLPRIFKK